MYIGKNKWNVKNCVNSCDLRNDTKDTVYSQLLIAAIVTILINNIRGTVRSISFKVSLLALTLRYSLRSTTPYLAVKKPVGQMTPSSAKDCSRGQLSTSCEG